MDCTHESALTSDLAAWQTPGSSPFLRGKQSAPRSPEFPESCLDFLMTRLCGQVSVWVGAALQRVALSVATTSKLGY